MDAIKMIKERRSVRKYQNNKVNREIMKDIVEQSRWAPSWGNFQVARYTLVDEELMIDQLAEEALLDHAKNIEKLTNAAGVVVLSCVKGKSGTMGGKYLTSKEGTWEMFDAGIAAQTFCLAAFAKGIGTCIMGGIDDNKIAEIVGLPEDETVAALIIYGYEKGEHANPSPRKPIEEILRFSFCRQAFGSES